MSTEPIANNRHVQALTPTSDDLEAAGREAGLTCREAQVVTLIAQGFTNEEIARQLYLSINSVKSYIRSAYRRIGVQRRSQAIVWAIESGLRTRPPLHAVN